MELQVGVKALLRNKDGKYLLVRRSPEKYPEVAKFGDMWDIPGGRIEPGIPLIDNLRREIKEEVSLELEANPKLIGAQDILRIPERHVVRLTYTGEIEGQPRLDDHHDEFGWFTIEEMKNMESLDIYLKEIIQNFPLQFIKENSLLTSPSRGGEKRVTWG